MNPYGLNPVAREASWHMYSSEPAVTAREPGLRNTEPSRASRFPTLYLRVYGGPSGESIYNLGREAPSTLQDLISEIQSRSRVAGGTESWESVSESSSMANDQTDRRTSSLVHRVGDHYKRLHVNFEIAQLIKAISTATQIHHQFRDLHRNNGTRRREAWITRKVPREFLE
jgi:hypothetical protein